MDVVDLVHAAGGVMRSVELVRGGIPKRKVAAAVATGELDRLRRFWVALPSADPLLRAAAQGGVVLTCVTEARRLGLWVMADDRVHVGAHPHAGGVAVDGATVHWDEPLVPRAPDALVDPIENVLATLSHCQPRDVALSVWESALNQGVIDRALLEHLPLHASARDLLADASPWSDSGLETVVVPRLRWLRVRIVPQAWILGHRVDFLIGDRLVLQIDGGTHVGAQRDSDNAHDARLALRGYHVIRVGYRQVVHDWPAVQDLVMRAIAAGLHRAA